MTTPYKRSAVDTNGYEVNGQSVDIAITEHGSDFYFAICAVMGFVGLAVVAASYLKPRSDRVFFWITAAINLTGK
jgi:bacteriorhodopsin